MFKYRFVNTKYWDDGYIKSLDKFSRYLYLYSFTNALTNICGVYEITMERISFDTGLTKEEIKEMLDKFSVDDKIYYFSGWLIVKNFIKNQKNSPSVLIGIKNELKNIPENVWANIREIKGLPEALGGQPDTAPGQGTSIPIPIPIPKLKLKPKLKPSLQAEACGNDINSLIKLFEPINPNYKILFKNLSQRKALERMVKEHSFRKVKEVIIVLPEIICQKYAPQISTPITLENKLGQLLIFIKQNKGQQGAIKV